MPSLPHDLIVDILTRLPVKTLLQFRCVCKPWYELTTSPYFVKMHLKRANENNDLKLMVVGSDGLYSMQFYGVSSAEIVNMDHPFNSSQNFALSFDYCNGLFCITIWVECRDELITCLWNPSTKEYKELPAIPCDIPDGSEYHHSEYYIGYDNTIEDYKVIRMVCYNQIGSFKYGYEDYKKKKYGYEVKVYTLGSNSWKSIEEIPYNSAYIRVGSGIFVNGALHWIIGKLIVSLDMGDEKYRLLPLPKSLDEEFDQMTLSLLEGCLCMLCRYGKERADVWLMKDYGVKECWTKLFTIGRKSLSQLLISVDKIEASVDYTYFRPIDIFKNGEILLHNGGMENTIPFLLYDPKHVTVRNLGRCLYRCRTAKAYVGSLVALNSGTYVGSLVALNSGTYVGSLVALNSGTDVGSLVVPNSGTYVEQRVDKEAELDYLFETALNKLFTGNPKEWAEIQKNGRKREKFFGRLELIVHKHYGGKRQSA